MNIAKNLTFFSFFVRIKIQHQETAVTIFGKRNPSFIKKVGFYPAIFHFFNIFTCKILRKFSQECVSVLKIVFSFFDCLQAQQAKCHVSFIYKARQNTEILTPVFIAVKLFYIIRQSYLKFLFQCCYFFLRSAGYLLIIVQIFFLHRIIQIPFFKVFANVLFYLFYLIPYLHTIHPLFS